MDQSTLNRLVEKCNMKVKYVCDHAGKVVKTENFAPQYTVYGIERLY